MIRPCVTRQSRLTSRGKFPLFSKYTYQLCNDVPSIQYSTGKVLEDFERDGVVYLELRTTPREFKETGLSKRKYVETILESIERYERGPSTSMKTFLLLSVDRRDTTQKAAECIDLAIQYKDRGVVGVDLCGDPLVSAPVPTQGISYMCTDR